MMHAYPEAEIIALLREKVEFFHSSRSHLKASAFLPRKLHPIPDAPADECNWTASPEPGAPPPVEAFLKNEIRILRSIARVKFADGV